MMGDYKFVLVFVALMSIGFFLPKPLDDLTVNLNLNESPKGHKITSDEIQKEFKTAKISSQAGKKQKPNQTKPNVKSTKAPGKVIKPTMKQNKPTDSICPDVHQKRDKPKRRKTRILNGLPVACPPLFEEPPWLDWIVSMQAERGPSRFDKCSGALISRRHILTALHCVESIPKRSNGKLDTVEHDKIKIFVRNLNFLEGTELKAEKIFYKSNDLIDGVPVDDIALIKLNKEIPKEVHINPISLPEKPLNEYDEYYEYWMAGWGYTKYHGIQFVEPNDLKQFMQTKRDIVECPDLRLLQPPEKQFCFKRFNDGTNRAHGSCNGDSGSPGVIFLRKPPSNELKWYLQGIHSAGAPDHEDPNSSGRCNDTKSFGVDMNVWHYKDSIMQWIKL